MHKIDHYEGIYNPHLPWCRDDREPGKPAFILAAGSLALDQANPGPPCNPDFRQSKISSSSFLLVTGLANRPLGEAVRFACHGLSWPVILPQFT